MSLDLYAFWRHDQFPFVLCGEVDRFLDDGRVYVKSYMGSFRPILIVPKPAGGFIRDRLELLAKKHRRLLQEAELLCLEELKEIMPEFVP